MRTNRLARAAVAALLLGTICLASTVDAAPTSVTTRGLQAADALILARIEKARPTASQIFVNCPKGNRVGLDGEPGEEPQITPGPGYICEFRYMFEGDVVKGKGAVLEVPPQGNQYELFRIATTSKAPPLWQVCDETFSARGTECKFSNQFLEIEIGSEAVASTPAKGPDVPRLLPSHFAVGANGANEEAEVEFVVERYYCHAHTRRIGRSTQRALVTCFTRFGDGIRYRFEGPAPPRRKA